MIITSALYVPALKEMKDDFPDCSYIVFDSRDIEGVTNIVFREEEGGFLAQGARRDDDAAERHRADKRRTGRRHNPRREVAAGASVSTSGYKAGSWYASPEVEVLCEYTGSFRIASRVEAAAAQAQREGR